MAASPGWLTFAGLALAVLTFSVVHPVLLVLVPVGLLLLALGPRRPQLVTLGLLLVGLVLVGARDMLWYAERGWILVLGAWFVTVVALWPGRSFLARGLGAVGAATATAGTVMLLRQDGWRQLDWTVTRTFRQTAATVAVEMSDPGTGGGLVDVLDRAAALQAHLYPSLLALGSLAALALAWWIYRRLVAGETPLAPLREFRFRDELVWLLIAGLALLVFPLGEAALRAGSNVTAFMAVLYALRGLAVLVALVGVPGPGTIVLAVVVGLILYPVVMTATLLVGLSDTWLDLRARAGSGTEGANR